MNNDLSTAGIVVKDILITGDTANVVLLLALVGAAATAYAGFRGVRYFDDHALVLRPVRRHRS